MNQYYTATDHFVLVPLLMLALFGTAVLLAEFAGLRKQDSRVWLLALTLLGLAFTAGSLWRQQQALASRGAAEVWAFGGTLVLDHFSLFFNWIFLAASALIVVILIPYLRQAGEPLAEFCGLILLAQSGMFLMVSALDLITLFIGLELMAVCFYILVGFRRKEQRSNEAAMKYLLLGGFSSAFLLYGFSLLYGISGATKLADIAQAIRDRGPSDPIVLLAIVLSSAGLLFKVAAVPFHMWAPDAYEGAPAPVAGYLAVASTAASFAFLLRLFLGPLASARPVWEPILVVSAVASLTLGNLTAITQNNIKRMLAYSSISHAGYILLGLIAGNDTGIQGITVYILVYTFMTLGAFLVLSAMQRDGVPAESMEDFEGLVHRHPAYALWMLLFLISLAGIPPTAGFLGKYYIFLSLIETGHYTLAVIATLYVAVSLYYYFRIVRSMFLRPEGAYVGSILPSFGLRLAVGIAGALTIAMGVYPEPFLRFARLAGGGG